MDTQQGANRAIIIGGSIAGLLSASVLASYFGQVTILERDTLTETIENRKGVPQGYHAHALLGQGHQIMEELFPGLAQALIRQGAALGNGRFFSGGGYFARHPQAPDKLYVSRACLETELRRRTLQISNVALVQACDVLG